MHARAARGEIPEKVVHEFDEATKKQKGGFAKLPEKVHHDAELGSTASWDQKRDAKLCEESKRR
jgi:hypothetical protein